MDTHGKSVSWFGNVREKFDTFCSDIDSIIEQDPFRYAENQLLTAGVNVKQFCSEFMQEVLPESITKTLKEKSPSLGENQKWDLPACEQIKKDMNEGHIKGLSDDSSSASIFMEIVEDGFADPPIDSETNGENGLCFEESRARHITFSSEVPKIEAYYDVEYNNGQSDFPKSLYCLPAKEGETSNPDNSKSADPKVELSTEQQLDNCIVPTVFYENPLLRNQIPFSGGNIFKGLVDLNDGLEDNKVDATGDNLVAKADMDTVESFRMVTTEPKCIMTDSSKLCLAPDLVDDPTCQDTLCKFCFKAKLEKGCECERAASSAKNGDAESDQSGGKSISLPDVSGESEPLEEDFYESDWVIV